MIRALAGIPLILSGQIITTLGYRVAGAPHLNPHNRTDRASGRGRRPS